MTVWNELLHGIFASDIVGSEYEPISQQHRMLGETAEPLFGSFLTMKPKIFSASLIIIVCAVVSVEFIFHYLDHISHDTKFNKNIRDIQTELMIVGCTAFIFKIIINNTSFINYDWFHALEFADIIIPIFSISHCFLGFGLVLMSVFQEKNIVAAAHLTVPEVMTPVYKARQNILHW